MGKAAHHAPIPRQVMAVGQAQIDPLRVVRRSPQIVDIKKGNTHPKA